MLRPGGAPHFVERGRSSDSAVARWQDRCYLRGFTSLNYSFEGAVASGIWVFRDARRCNEAGAPVFVRVGNLIVDG